MRSMIAVMPPDRDPLAGLGRYADPSLAILTSLAGGPRHGYAMIADIEAMGAPRLRPGTLYGALTRLEERGLVEALPSEERRRPYRLTAAGAEALRAQVAHLEQVTSLARAR